ncbi:leucyl aminopeptidase family protein [Arenimonas sp.]|jgi:leucyl aminopeptidase|uniref:leucyl aminopeptidase family protein n=1 Tax=Arenimonas sp. TaxID=1872635 RepID=UPI0037C106B0
MTSAFSAQGLSKERHPQSRSIIFVSAEHYPAWLTTQTEFIRNWLASQSFQGRATQFVLLPDASGQCHQVVAVISGDTPYAIAHLPKLLPKGHYHRSTDSTAALSADNLLLGWGLGAYRFERYVAKIEPAVLHAEDQSACAESVLTASLEVRDWINTPTEHMGPDELEQATRYIGASFGASVSSICGEELLTQNFPTIHAVGRASHRAPRLIRLDWGDDAHPHIVLCGKGVCFDTGGLDIKAADGMRNMKKDMGGAAHALGLARLLMQNTVPVRLTLLIAAVENAIAGNAFRPGDVITTRQGLSVEIDNTDAEGRLVLSDALTLAGELKPDLIMDFATLTGAARIALGPDLPVLFCNHAETARDYLAAGETEHDPLWQLPLWQPYLGYLKSNVADLANSGASKMAGCMTAALFLQRFVPAGTAWTHLDVYSWNDSERPGKPAGGEAQGLRAAFRFLQKKYDHRHSTAS